MSDHKLKIFLDKDSTIPELTVTFLQEFGMESLVWEPEISKGEIEGIIGKPVEEQEMEKLEAGLSIIYTNAIEIYPEVFEKFCLLSANKQVSDEWQPVTPEELLTGLATLSLLQPKDFQPWAEVIAYIDKCFQAGGYVQIPRAALNLMTVNTYLETDAEKEKQQPEKEEAAKEFLSAAVQHRLDRLKLLEVE